MRIVSYLFVLTCLITVHDMFSQMSRVNGWKRYRKEIILQVGASGFLGDLGGRDLSGTDFSPVDFEIGSTRTALSIAYRYKFTKQINWHASLNYLLLSGDDKLTHEKYRNNRNLNFKTNLYEIATRFEFCISSMRRQGVYSIKRHLGKTHKRRNYEVIAFIGLGGFYFNPKGKNPNTDEYVNLYNLHTEGQGLSGGPKQYKRVGLSIPMGLALHTVINKEWSVGLEYSYRITFTDYIDDVSTRYYDKALLSQAYGSESALMSDPSKGDIVGATAPAGDGKRAQRGDKNKDSYMTLQITVGRLIKSKKAGRTRLRSKF